MSRLPAASCGNAFSKMCSIVVCRTEPDHDAYAYLVTRRVLLCSVLATVLSAMSLSPSSASISGTPTGWSEASYFSVRHAPVDASSTTTDTCALFSDLYTARVLCTRYLQVAQVPPAPPPLPIISPVPGNCVGCLNDANVGIPQTWFQLYVGRGCGASDVIGNSLSKGCTAVTTLLNMASTVHALITLTLLSLMGHLATQFEALARMWGVRGGVEFVVGAGLKTRLPLGTMTRMRPSTSWQWLLLPSLFAFIVVIAWPSAVTVSLIFMRDDLKGDATAIGTSPVLKQPSLSVRPGTNWYLQFFSLVLLITALLQSIGLEIRLKQVGMERVTVAGILDHTLGANAGAAPQQLALQPQALQPKQLLPGPPTAAAGAQAASGAPQVAAAQGVGATHVVANPFGAASMAQQQQQQQPPPPPVAFTPPPPPLEK